MTSTSTRKRATLIATVAVLALTVTGCAATPAADDTGAGGKIAIVGAENQYSDVAAQIGGRYVTVTSVMSDPNTDPHTFEATVGVARAVAAARIVVQNGLGYDDFMTRLESASPAEGRTVIVAQRVRGLPDDTPNPHLWYDPATMPAVAARIATVLGRIRPAQRAYFQRNLEAFTRSMHTWVGRLDAFRHAHAGVAVAVTEPVADDLLRAAGAAVKTPWTLQAAIMNGTDPSPQDSAAQDALLTGRRVAAFLYNRQVTDPVTSRYLALARAHRIPVVGVYETMPAGYHYQAWMDAELAALGRAVEHGTSTETLQRPAEATPHD